MVSNPIRVGAGTSLALVAALVGCGGSAGARAAEAPQTHPVAATTVALQIKDFTYSPATLRVRHGQKIRVVNKDAAVHTITAKKFDSKNLKKGQSFTFSIAKPGTYRYICDLHQYMTGKIVVS